MKALPILVLLSSVAQFCSAAAPLQPVTCSEDGGAAAARLAMHHINEHHDHGYKFKLDKVNSTKLEKVDDGCNIELQLDLLQTKCHTVNPKHFEDCDTPDEDFKAVMASCTVTMTVKDTDAKVTKYDCDTRKVHTNSEMVMMCPDCPTMIALNSPEGLKAVHEAVQKFNMNSTNQHIYILQEVGLVLSTYIMMRGMNYYPEFVLVETHCPWGTKIMPEACNPLCPDRAHHAFCRASYSSAGLTSLECEVYPPTNTTALGLGEQEPVCRPLRRVGPPPPDPTSHQGPAAPPVVQERQQHGLPPQQSLPPCNGVLTNINPVLHPICPWPLPDPHPNPRLRAD